MKESVYSKVYKRPRVNRQRPTSNALEIYELREQGLSFGEIGKRLGISRQRAHQACLQVVRPIKEDK